MDAAGRPLLLHETIVWERLTGVFAIPAGIVTAIYTGVAAFYCDGQAFQVFQEEWFRGCTDRWSEFGSQIKAKSEAHEVASPSGEVLAAVFPEFKQHLFAIVRCIRANSRLFSNVRKTDTHRIQELVHENLHFQSSLGDSNNCLIDSLIINLITSGHR